MGTSRSHLKTQPKLPTALFSLGRPLLWELGDGLDNSITFRDGLGMFDWRLELGLFDQKATTAAAVVSSINVFKTPVYGQSTAPSSGRVIGANDRISIGYIGIGGKPSNCPGMGLGHILATGWRRLVRCEGWELCSFVTSPFICDIWNHGRSPAIDLYGAEGRLNSQEMADQLI